MRYLLFSRGDPHLRLSLEETYKFVHGVMGVLPESSPNEVGLSVKERTTDSLRTVCKILSPLRELCKGQCLRLHIPSRHVEVLHIHSILHVIVAFQAIELSSLTWKNICRTFPQLCLALPCCLWREQAARINLFSRLAMALL